MNVRAVAISASLLLACSNDQRGTSGGQTAEAGNGAVASMRPLDALANRVWIRTDSTGLPGVLRVFLVDGTMLMDSCWETYRLTRWDATSDTTLRWTEDGASLSASVRMPAADSMVLRLQLPGQVETQRYALAHAPYTCPDMKR